MTQSRLRLFLLALFLLLLLLNFASESAAYTIKYDLSFKRWGEFYFPFDDWKWFKSQGTAESNLDANAISWCGAVGLMQIMPATATGLGVKNRWDAEESIQGGVKYDKQVDGIFKMISQPERRKFMFAGYNAGPGNIIKAKKIANSPFWDKVALCLEKVTGKHSTETIGYVKRIYHIKEIL